MKLVTYIDGHAQTPYGVLLTRHSFSCSVDIKPEHEAAWLEMLTDLADSDADVRLPTDRKAPVPFTVSTDALGDMVSDTEEESHVAPYLQDLQYMCGEDPCGMGVVYLMGRQA